jgi:hypothetical protein
VLYAPGRCVLDFWSDSPAPAWFLAHFRGLKRLLERLPAEFGRQKRLGRTFSVGFWDRKRLGNGLGGRFFE